MTRYATLLSILWLCSCLSMHTKIPKPRDARSLLPWVPDSAEAVFVIDLEAFREHPLGKQLLPLLRETKLYQLFAAQLHNDFLMSGKLFGITTTGIGTHHAKVMFLLDGEPHSIDANPQTVYVLQNDIGLFFPSKTMILLGNKELVELAFRQSLGQRNNIEQNQSFQDLLPRVPSIVFGAMLVSSAAQLRFPKLQHWLQSASALSFSLNKENTLQAQLVWPNKQPAQDYAIFVTQRLLTPNLWVHPITEMLQKQLHLTQQENKLLFSLSPSSTWIDWFSQKSRTWLEHWLQPKQKLPKQLSESTRMTLGSLRK